MFISTVAIFLFASFFRSTESKDGIVCGICQLLVQEIEHLGGVLTPKMMVNGMRLFCKVLEFNPELSERCTNLVDDYGMKIADYIYSRVDPSEICVTLGICDQCRLYSVNSWGDYDEEMRHKELAAIIMTMGMVMAYGDNPMLIKPEDKDGDRFSPFKRWGGNTGQFFGKDCNDDDNSIHPLLKGVPNDETDNNCNGIHGTDEVTGVTYQEKFCDHLGQDDRNLIAFGDSVCTGFGIDPDWVSLKKVSDMVKKALFSSFCWPEKSLTSGFDTTSSLYLEMRKINRCAHRQFANLCVTGAVMGDLVDQVKSFPGLDGNNPSLVYLGYIGNDVCKSEVSQMTEPEVFKSQLLEGLETLNNVVKNGSRVVLVGLSNGKQYELMHNMSHPLSSEKHTVTFSQFYDFMNCVDMNPCGTWLNSDPNMRAAATQRALELDGVMDYVSKNYKFANYRLVYIDIDDVINRGVQNLIDDGVESYKFFNRVDGFHPSIEYGHPYGGEAFFEVMQARFPGFLGKENYYNSEIENIFGDQGGY